ncbi:MAG TPA: hypothetical protein VE058_03885 [Steroidobacteraceae bacterium]|nr:hypothetical protein [Steroidobacteraceae bacterium]
MRARNLSKLERLAAICLSLIWVAGGCVALGAALTHSRWIMALVSVAAIGYGIAWARVALRSRLLTWPELFMPRRPSK